MPLPRVVNTVAELRTTVAAAHDRGTRVGLVPTIGALHAGHLSLVAASAADCGLTIVSIFVNPAQFGPNEDFARYPRALESDRAALAACTVPLVVFAPSVEDVYPAGHATWVTVESVAAPLEGAHRPGHFRGVATVVLKLFLMAGADVAWFGQKDYQQALVIRRMVADLNVPIEVRVCPIVREPDGLAMSSRNAYLTPDGRRRAVVLWQSLDLARELVAGGERDAVAIAARMALIAAAGGVIEYVALVDPDSLAPVETIRGPTLAALAVRIEQTRLIDNMILDPA